MPCKNCYSTRLSMNSRLNLYVCQDCELIQANRIWESSTVFKHDEKRDFSELDLICGEFDIVKYKEDFQRNYNTLVRAGLFNGYEINIRWCAVIYYTLQDLNIPVYVRKYCRFLGCDSRVVFRLAKRIGRHFGKVGVFILDDLDEYYDRSNADRKVLEPIIEQWSEEETLTRGILAALFYENTEMTQLATCKLFGVSLPRLKRHLTKVRRNE